MFRGILLCALGLTGAAHAKTLYTAQTGMDGTCNVELDPTQVVVSTGDLVTVEVEVDPGVAIDGFRCVNDVCTADFETTVSVSHLLMFDNGDPTKTGGALLEVFVARDGTTSATVGTNFQICGGGVGAYPAGIPCPSPCCACPCEPGGCGSGW